MELERHLDDAQLQAIVEGEASLSDHAAHLDACRACRDVLTASLAVAPPRAPKTLSIGRYEVRGLLGEGGMGVVYRAWDPQVRREVALKVWSAGAHDSRSSLLHEARTMARLDHPGLARVFDAGHDEAVGTYIATALVEGASLRAWARTARPRERLRTLAKVADSLCAAHDAGVVHGDLKPDNVVVRRGGEPVVTDFGLALLDGRGPRGGTPGYLAPEASASTAADQYAFCTMAREVMGAGRLASGLARVWDRGTRASPEQRWRSMAAVRAAMGRADRRPWVVTSIGAVALMGVGVLAVDREPCPLDPEGMAERWRAHRAALETSGVPDGFDRELAAIDDHVARWTAAARRACEEPRRRPCVLRAEAELEALWQQLEATDAPWSLGIVGWVAQLPQPDACLDERPRPSPRLADARAMRRAGDLRGASERAGRIALSTDDPQLAAEAELLRGKTLVGVDEAQARQSLWRATVSANSVTRPDLEAEGLLGLAMLEARDPARVADAQRLLERADALVRRHDLPLRPAVAFIRGAVAMARGDAEASLTAMAEADRLAATLLPSGDPFRLQYALEHAAALSRLGRHREAAERLEDLAARTAEVLGQAHPRTALVDAELAAQLANLGDWSEARDRLTHAIDRLSAVVGEGSAVVLDLRRDLGVVHIELGQIRSAERNLVELHRLDDEAQRHRPALEALCLAGDAALAAEDTMAAEYRYLRAVDYARDAGLGGATLGGCLARLGVVESMIEDPGAQQTLERALILLEGPEAATLDVALARFALARIIAEDDVARAYDLAHAAMEILSGGEGVVATRRRAEIDAWMRGRG